MRFLVRMSLMTLAAIVCASCGSGLNLQNILNQGGGAAAAAFDPIPPGVAVARVELAQAPTDEMLAGHFCMQATSGIPMNRLLCGMFATVPTQEQLQFAFDIQIDVTNPNPVPVPVVSALFGFTAYPDGDGQHLGMVCATFCENPQTCSQDTDEACRGGDEPEIRGAEDLVNAAAGFLFRVATGQNDFEDLRLKTVEPNGTLPVSIRLALNINEMLQLIERMGEDQFAQIRNRQQPRFVIPYMIEGSVWITVENFGRFATGFGPVTGEWPLDEAINEATQGG